MLNLQDFCGDQAEPPERSWIHRPFSRGEFTYATNGHIMVRVPRQDAFPEVASGPALEKLDDVLFAYKADFEAPSIDPPEAVLCGCCNGTGRVNAHDDCPHCKCDSRPCDICDGTGKTPEVLPRKIGNVMFAGRYIRQLLALPGIEVPRKPKSGQPMPFKFTGGIGALMPLNRAAS